MRARKGTREGEQPLDRSTDEYLATIRRSEAPVSEDGR